MGNEKINYKTIAEQIFLAGVESVLPSGLITKKMFLKDNSLIIGPQSYSMEAI